MNVFNAHFFNFARHPGGVLDRDLIEFLGDHTTRFGSCGMTLYKT